MMRIDLICPEMGILEKQGFVLDFDLKIRVYASFIIFDPIQNIVHFEIQSFIFRKLCDFVTLYFNVHAKSQ